MAKYEIGQTENDIATRLWAIRYMIPNNQVNVEEYKTLVAQQSMLQKYATQKDPKEISNE